MIQAGSDPHGLLQELLALETRVWRALKEGNRDADAALLAPDFLGVYPSGFAGRDDHADQLQQGPSVDWFEISQARIIPVGNAHGMLCYLARYCRPGQTVAEEMYVSSLWRREGSGWRNLFSQDSPVSDAPIP